MGNKTLVTIFARCFRQIAKLSAVMDDRFFVDLLNEEAEKLLGRYMVFLRWEGIVGGDTRVAQSDILQHQDVAKYSDIVQHDTRVAQCRSGLIYQIKNILSLLNILKHLELKEPITSLLLERDLLLLELTILNNRQEELPNSKMGKHNSKSEKLKTKSQIFSDSLGLAHKQIARFITGRDRTQNTEIFRKFSNIAKRTLKRKLSELVEASVIKRVATGKKVFYVIKP